MSLDTPMQVTSWTNGAEDIYGYTSEEMLGESSDVLISSRRNP